MDKQTKLLLGLGLAAVAAYFLFKDSLNGYSPFKKPTVPVATKQPTPDPQEMDYAHLPKPEQPNDNMAFNGKNYVDTMKNNFFKTKFGQFSKN